MKAHKSTPKKVFKQEKPWLLEWRKPLGLPECPYVYRWTLGTPFGSIRVHNWKSSDDDRAHHDHPWSFLTVVLRGGYTDVSPTVIDKHSGVIRDHLRVGSVRYRAAEHVHTVQVDPGGCLTLLLTGPEKRFWGFWLRNKWRKAGRYFRLNGHHPCGT